MKTEFTKQIKFLVSIFVLATLLLGCSKITSLFGDKDKLYFCERYDAVKGEIGESDKFTTGTLTVMVKLAKPIGVTDVDINITDTKTSKVIETKPFTVSKDMTYIFFDNVGFDTPGKYKVSCLKKDGTVIVTGNIEIVEK
jgi:hypothetical protein